MARISLKRIDPETPSRDEAYPPKVDRRHKMATEIVSTVDFRVDFLLSFYQTLQLIFLLILLRRYLSCLCAAGHCFSLEYSAPPRTEHSFSPSSRKDVVSPPPPPLNPCSTPVSHRSAFTPNTETLALRSALWTLFCASPRPCAPS